MFKLKSLCITALLFSLIITVTSQDAKAVNFNAIKSNVVSMNESNRSVVTDRLITTSNLDPFDTLLKNSDSALIFAKKQVFKKSSTIKPNVTSTQPKEDSTPYFPLTDRERDKIERVTMASCGDYGYDMMKSNAQVILDRIKSGKFGDGVDSVLDAPHQFEKPTTGYVNSNVKRAVSAVFDHGERMSETPIYYYVNPNIAEVSAETWRKGKTYVMTVGKGMFIHEYWTEK